MATFTGEKKGDKQNKQRNKKETKLNQTKPNQTNNKKANKPNQPTKQPNKHSFFVFLEAATLYYSLFSSLIHLCFSASDLVGRREDGGPKRLRATWYSRKWEAAPRHFAGYIVTQQQAFVNKHIFTWCFSIYGRLLLSGRGPPCWYPVPHSTINRKDCFFFFFRVPSFQIQRDVETLDLPWDSKINPREVFAVEKLISTGRRLVNKSSFTPPVTLFFSAIYRDPMSLHFSQGPTLNGPWRFRTWVRRTLIISSPVRWSLVAPDFLKK